MNRKQLPTKSALLEAQPLTEQQQQHVATGREAIRKVLSGEDPRQLLIVGPCSIHDESVAIAYARHLVSLQETVAKDFLLVMRAYFEKPRTVTGWTGFLHDPHIDGSCAIGEGIARARALLRELLDIGVYPASEAVDPFRYAYLEDAICWTAIGARTVESPIHRQYASCLTQPVGFKNSTAGSIEAAVHAACAASHSHQVIDPHSHEIFTSVGNRDTNIILRGSTSGPNYDERAVLDAVTLCRENKIRPSILIDCSHGNSGKKAARQPAVLDDALAQVAAGNPFIRGCMLESNLHSGKQSPFASEHKFGVSITDECLSWEETAMLIEGAAVKLQNNTRQEAAYA